MVHSAQHIEGVGGCARPRSLTFEFGAPDSLVSSVVTIGAVCADFKVLVVKEPPEVALVDMITCHVRWTWTCHFVITLSDNLDQGELSGVGPVVLDLHAEAGRKHSLSILSQLASQMTNFYSKRQILTEDIKLIIKFVNL